MGKYLLGKQANGKDVVIRDLTDDITPNLELKT